MLCYYYVLLTLDKTAATVSATPTENNTTKPALEEKPVKKLALNQEESSEDSSDTDSDDSDSDNEGKPAAPIELKGEFIKYLMDEDYEKAKELCQKSKYTSILLYLLNVI